MTPAYFNSPETFASRLVPAWLKVVLEDGTHPAPVAESIDANGKVIIGQPSTTLAQGRTAFMLAHLYLTTGHTELLVAAKRIHAFMMLHLRDEDGGFRYAVNPDGTKIDSDECRLRRTYDQSFALLSLVTLRKADPSFVTQAEIDNCIAYIEGTLTDPITGALWEDDVMAHNGAKPGDFRAQNPHMHMLESVMQGFEMDGDPIWMERAAKYVALGEKYFFDAKTGAVCEFIGHDLTQNDTEMGQRREPGHQFEWDWLLRRYAGFAKDDAPRALAKQMRIFVEENGIRPDGVMAGAAYDAVDAKGTPTDDTHLLWPMTEAGKVYASLAVEMVGVNDLAAHNAIERVRAISDQIFAKFFHQSNPAWVNRLDGEGTVLWDEGLSRLLYHMAIFITEGDRARVWSCERA
jgi:mannose-6-phosphate isomerase